MIETHRIVTDTKEESFERLKQFGLKDGIVVINVIFGTVVYPDSDSDKKEYHCLIKYNTIN